MITLGRKKFYESKLLMSRLYNRTFTAFSARECYSKFVSVNCSFPFCQKKTPYAAKHKTKDTDRKEETKDLKEKNESKWKEGKT